MRLWKIALPVFLTLPAMAHAEQGFLMCNVRSNYFSTTDTVYYSGLIPVTYSGQQDYSRQGGETAAAFQAYLERRGLDVLRASHCDQFGNQAAARAELTRRMAQHQPGYFQETGWTIADPSIADRWVPGSSLTAAARPASPLVPRTIPARRAPASTAGARPGLYIGMPNETASQETEAQRAAAQREVAAENARQLARARAAEAERQRAQAAHQERLAEYARAQAAHRQQMAENQRRQQAYERARAEWEARVAACRAGNRDACVARATPQ